jgi:hypothetical protein
MLEFTKKIIGTVNVLVEITESDIENIIVTSFEGGSNYWMGLDNSKPEFDNQTEDEPTSTWATKILLEGNTIYLYDIEDEEEKWTLTLDKLLNGIKLNAMERTFDSDLENMDATTADCIVQYALFSKVVYG